MSQTVPVIISCDIDPSPEASSEERIKAFNWTSRLFTEYGINATFFTVAEVAERFPDAIQSLSYLGHEIGCHGLTHDETEEYSILSEDEQVKRLSRATGIINRITDKPVISFRGPRVKTSTTTQKILIELGYRVDSSICSQRIDFLSSNLINPGWIFAPRLPYQPNEKSVYRRGERDILVIPVSAMVLPLLSGVLYTFGLKFTKFLFNILYHESKINNKPIVYLMHPAEFAVKTKSPREKFSVKVEGVTFRRNSLIFENDIEKRYQLHVDFFKYLASRQNIEFITMNEYAQRVRHR